MSNKDIEISESRRRLFSRFNNQPAPTKSDGFFEETVGDRLPDFGISRRGFMQFCAGMAALMGLPPSMLKALAADLLELKPSVIYMSFQECTGCLESLVNLTSPTTIGNVILDIISLDYQETIMAAAGKQAEEWRTWLITPEAQNPHPEYSQSGKYVLVVDGSIPVITNDPDTSKIGRFSPSPYFVSGGQSGVKRFIEAAQYAEAVVALGTCASWGGIARAKPNPTGAVSVWDLMEDKGLPTGQGHLINVPGCPPIAEVIAGVLLAHILHRDHPDKYPAVVLDELLRPVTFYGPPSSRGPKTVHSDCERLPYFLNADPALRYAKSFDDEATRDRCLYKLGCKGPRTRNACTTVKWNQGIGYPMKSGHGCIGCSEPNFWDGVYETTAPTRSDLKNYPQNLTLKGFYDPLPPRSTDLP
jgi:hydrogenase small subunit